VEIIFSELEGDKYVNIYNYKREASNSVNISFHIVSIPTDFNR